MADDAPVEDVPVEEEVEEEVEMSVLDALKEVSVRLSHVIHTFKQHLPIHWRCSTLHCQNGLEYIDNS